MFQQLLLASFCYSYHERLLFAKCIGLFEKTFETIHQLLKKLRSAVQKNYSTTFETTHLQ